MNRFALPLQYLQRSALQASRLHCNAVISSPLIPRTVVVPVSCIHSSRQRLKKAKKELSSEPTRFTSSPANIRSMPSIPESRNPYQPIIVSVSIFIFIIYFLLLREENDLDEELNFGLFERVPQLEEPHLTQAIPRMRDAGMDTREVEKRLHELREARLARQAEKKEKEQ